MSQKNLHDPQDRSYWFKYGAKKEKEFVEHICPKIGLNAQINPEKENDPVVPDLLVNGRIADLKYQTTPFFYAGRLYGIDPRFGVGLNHKDVVYYNERHPYIDLYFWVHWRVTYKRIGKFHCRVKPLRGIWRAPLREINHLIETGKAHLHQYKKRINDKQGNAPDSYIMDLRNFTQIKKENMRKKRCYIDLETSGLKPGQAVILAIGAIIESGEEFYTLIRPTKDEWALASPEALKVNGITWDMVKDAPMLDGACKQLIDFLCEHRIFRGEAVFVGQNLSFDLKFLQYYMGHELEKAGVPLDDYEDVMLTYLRSTWLEMVPFTWNLKGHTISKALKVEEESEIHNALEGARVVKRNMEALDAALAAKNINVGNLDDK